MADSEPNFDLLERDIAARLKPVCAEMSDEEFAALVRDIARVKLKYGLESLGNEQLHGPTAGLIRAVINTGEQPKVELATDPVEEDPA
ncbi:MAG: hypothetical protein ABI875_09615 [Gemmatimonadales bacterium]